MKSYPSAQLSFNKGICFLGGHLDYHNVMQAHQQLIEAKFSESEPAIIDLSQLKSADTTLLALLTHWFKVSLNFKNSLTLMSVPSFLQNMMDLFGLDFDDSSKVQQVKQHVD